MRIDMTAEASPGDVIAVIKSDRDAKKWMYRAKQFYSFDPEGEDTWYTYTEMSVPWPFSNRDLVLKNELEWSGDRNAARIKLTGIPDHIPVEGNLKRIEHFDGSWSIDPIEPGKVLVRYEVFTKSEPVLPRWIIDPIVEQGFWDTMYKMRTMVRAYSEAVASRNK
jgi:hypothetical protein